MEDECYFNKACLCRVILVLTVHLWFKESFSSWYGKGRYHHMEIYAVFIIRNLYSAFRQKWEGRELFLQLLIINYIQCKVILCQGGLF